MVDGARKICCIDQSHQSTFRICKTNALSKSTRYMISDSYSDINWWSRTFFFLLKSKQSSCWVNWSARKKNLRTMCRMFGYRHTGTLFSGATYKYVFCAHFDLASCAAAAVFYSNFCFFFIYFHLLCLFMCSKMSFRLPLTFGSASAWFVEWVSYGETNLVAFVSVMVMVAAATTANFYLHCHTPIRMGLGIDIL